MIDLHCHMLPGIDDGAVDLETSLAMARMAVADGVTCVACTPHIYPGMYENDAPGIRRAIDALQRQLDQNGIALRLVQGADVHLQPDLIEGIRAGRIPTLNGTRYLLLEPPHHVAPPRFAESLFALQAAGYVPVVTHPERLSWIEDHYETFVEAVRTGCWMQLTAGSLVGRFGRRPKYWSERMLDEGLVHILATDAHDLHRRPPLLSEGREAAARRVGERESENMVLIRTEAIIANRMPDEVAPRSPPTRATGWRRWFKL